MADDDELEDEGPLDNYYARIDKDLVRGESLDDGSYLIEVYNAQTDEFDAALERMNGPVVPLANRRWAGLPVPHQGGIRR